MKKIIFALCISLYCSYGTSSAAISNLGVHGAVFEIAEKDLLDEIMDRAAKVDWKKVFKKEDFEEKVKNWQPEGVQSLPAATTENSFLVDMTYTLQFDIPDGKGGILYPKGFVFKPTALIQYPMTLAVIDGSNKDQVEWFKASGYNKLNTKVLLSGGSWYEVGKLLKRPVYVVDQVFIDRFQVKATPSIIKQDGLYMKVREIYVPAKR